MARRILESGSVWKVGGRQRIKVWEDRWLLPSGHSKVLTPRHPNTDISYVSDLIHYHPKLWNASKVNAVFNPIDAQAILSIPLPHRNICDRLLWPYEKIFDYSVRLAYHWSMSQYNWGNYIRNYNKVEKIMATQHPSKIQDLLLETTE